MSCAWLFSVEWAYLHEPEFHRGPVRSSDVLDVGHVMTWLTMFEKSSISRFLSDRHAIFCDERRWPSYVRLWRLRVNSTSCLPATCYRSWHVLTKCDFRTFDFVTLLTGSGNENQKSGSVTTPECVSGFQKWNPHVDITSGSPAIAPPNWRKRLFMMDVWKFAINPFPVSWPRPSGGVSCTCWYMFGPNLSEIAVGFLCEMIFWSFEPPSCFLGNVIFNFSHFLIECV